MLNTDLIYWKNDKKTNCTKNRIINEIGNLIFQCETVNFKFINNEYNISIFYNNHYYDITVPQDYPFKIPEKLYINGTHYKKLLSTTEPKINECLKKYYHIDCLCCSSIMCPAHWSPTFNISKIINNM